MTLSLLNTSISATTLILLMLFVRFVFFHYLPKQSFKLLWVIILIRLLFPISFLNINPIIQLEEDSLAHRSFRQISINVHRIEQNTIFYTIWFLIAILILLIFIIPYIVHRYHLQSSQSAYNKDLTEIINVSKLSRKISIVQIESDKITPFTYGVVWPVLVIPSCVDQLPRTQIQYVFLHELVHIKQFDVLFKWLLMFAACMHWFNPAVWLMYIMTNRDVELACDENVLSLCGYSKKSEYAKTLLDLEENKLKAMPLINYFGIKNIVEERIVSIMKHKRASKKTSIIVFLLVVAFLLVGFITLSYSNPLDYNNMAQSDSGVKTKITDENMENKGDTTYIPIPRQ